MTGVEIAGLALSAMSTVGAIKSRQAQQEVRQKRFAIQQQQRALKQRIQERRIERERKEATAAQRARMGAAGLSSSGGSADAIFAGINKQADQQLNDLRQSTALTQRSVDLLADDTGDNLQNLAGFGQQVLNVAGPVLGRIEDDDLSSTSMETDR